MNNSIERMNIGKLKKCLDREYRFSSGVMTLGQHFELYPPIYKTLKYQKYASKKRNGCYAELKTPKPIYTLWKENDLGIDVPKMVFDYFDVPDRSR